MKNHGKVVTTSDFPNFELLAKMNRSYPSFSFHVVYDNYSWEKNDVGMRLSPTIYFFLDGKLKGRSVGADRVKDFCENSQKIGVRLPKTCP